MRESASHSIDSETSHVELTLNRLLCIWWAYFWRHLLYGGGAVIIVGFLEGLAGLGGKRLLLSLSAVLVMAAVSFCMFGVVLSKKFRHFHIRIVASPR